MLCAATAESQPWKPLLDANRAIDWSASGVGGIPRVKKLITSELGYPTYDIPDKLTKNLSMLFPYSAKDTVASLLLAQKFSETLALPDNRRIRRLYRTVIRKMDALYTKIELKGWPVHRGEAERVLADLSRKQFDTQTAMLAYLDLKNITEIPVNGKVIQVDDKTLTSPQKLAVLIFDVLGLPQHPDKVVALTESGARSTKEDALVHIQKHPFISLLLDYRGFLDMNQTVFLGQDITPTFPLELQLYPGAGANLVHRISILLIFVVRLMFYHLPVQLTGISVIFLNLDMQSIAVCVSNCLRDKSARTRYNFSLDVRAILFLFRYSDPSIF